MDSFQAGQLSEFWHSFTLHGSARSSPSIKYEAISIRLSFAVIDVLDWVLDGRLRGFKSLAPLGRPSFFGGSILYRAGVGSICTDAGRFSAGLMRDSVIRSVGVNTSGAWVCIIEKCANCLYNTV